MKKSRHSSAEDRARHIALWQQSGLSRAAYCRDAGLAYYLLKDWLRSAKRRSQQRDRAAVVKGRSTSSVDFVRVPLPTAHTDSARPMLCIDGFSDFSIQVFADCDMPLLQAVLKAVRTC